MTPVEFSERPFGSAYLAGNSCTVGFADLSERYVQAQSQAQAQTQGTDGSPSNSTFISGSLSPISKPAAGLNRLAHPTIIEHIINDWFLLIYSVCPIFHHASFMERLRLGDAAIDCEFAAVVASICAATIASLRSNRFYGDVTVDRCLQLVDQIDSALGQRSLTLEWCQVKYNLYVAIGTERGIDDELGYRFISEAVMGIKYLIFYQLPAMSFTSQQLLKRLYWLVFAGLWYATCCMNSATKLILNDSTLDLHGRPTVGLLSPQDNVEALTPLELSDKELDPAHVYEDDQWHGRDRSYIAGLNYMSKLNLLWHSSQRPSNDRSNHLQSHTAQIQRVLDYLPSELLWRGGLSRPPQSNFGTQVQTANLYITQLHIRSNLLEQINRLAKSSGEPCTPPVIMDERQNVVADMLEILYHMPDETLEANGHSLIPKIRDIGSALLDEMRTGDRPQPLSSKAAANLDRLLAKLESLDMHSRKHYMGEASGT